MRKGRVGLWALTGASVVALTATSVAGAGHDGTNVFHLGVLNTTGSGSWTGLNGSFAGNLVQVINSNSTGTAIFGHHSNYGFGNGVRGATDSTAPDASGVLGEVFQSSADATSAGVRGFNSASGAGVLGESRGGWGVKGKSGGEAAVLGENSGPVSGFPFGAISGVGVMGTHDTNGFGVFGESPGGIGVLARTSTGTGVHARSNAGTGVFGMHDARVGTSPGVWGATASDEANSAGVLGELSTPSPGNRSAGVRGVVPASNPAPYSAGVYGVATTSGVNGVGVFGEHGGSGVAVYGQTPSGTGVRGVHDLATGAGPGVYGTSNSDAAGAAGVEGLLQGTGAAAGSAGVYGQHGGTGALGIGVRGHHAGGGNGVYGSVQNSVVNAAGVLGEVLGTGGGGVGVYGAHRGSGYGVYGNAFGNGGAGVVGQAPAGAGWAGYFTGNVHVTGALSKGGGAFKIDHPVDPENKYLQHSFVESPDMKNVYDGVVRTDKRGFATVKLPSYFSALNRDFRYQLTVIGRPGEFVDAMVVKEITNDRFTIQSEQPLTKVSWQVTGIRKDRWANANRIEVEQPKPAAERGRYLNPELYGASKADSVLRPLAAPRVPAGKRTN